MTEDFRAITTRLRVERGMTMEDLAFEARRHAPSGAVSLSLIQKRLAPGSAATPSSGMLQALAAALGVPPETYPEYRLAIARRALDEREVGLEAALATLSAIEDALAASATEHALHAVQPAPDRQRRPRAAGREA